MNSLNDLKSNPKSRESIELEKSHSWKSIAYNLEPIIPSSSSLKLLNFEKKQLSREDENFKDLILTLNNIDSKVEINKNNPKGLKNVGNSCKID